MYYVENYISEQKSKRNIGLDFISEEILLKIIAFLVVTFNKTLSNNFNFFFISQISFIYAKTLLKQPA